MYFQNGITPSQSLVLWGGAVEVHCFGMKTGNWSMRGATPEEAERNNPGILDRLIVLSEKYATGPIYAPNPSTFNGKVVGHRSLDAEWVRGRLFRGVDADGVALARPGTAFAVSSADCPTVISYEAGLGTVVAAHAGLKSLTPPSDLAGSIRRVRMQVRFDAQEERIDAPRHQAFIVCGIGVESYRFDPSHPTYGSEQETTCAWLQRHYPSSVRTSEPFDVGRRPMSWRVSLPSLIRSQLCTFDADAAGHDGVCTFADLGPEGRPLWHSNRRDGAKAGRNLVLVIRRK